MFIFFLLLSLLIFSGWIFYKSAAEAGKHIEAKIGSAGIGVAIFMALSEILPRFVATITGVHISSVYGSPFSFLILLFGGVLVYAAARRGLKRILQNTSDSFLADPKKDATTDDGTLPLKTAGRDKTDRVVRATAIVFLIYAGLAGGAKSWAGAADELPFLMWLVTLPALAVWFGRRSASLKDAAIEGGIFGAVFILPSFLLYQARDFGENVFALVASIGIPAIVALVAFSTKGAPITSDSSDEQVKSRANLLTIGSLAGIILPQFFQPAVLDEVRAMNAVAAETGNQDIKQSVSVANILSRIFLVLTALVSGFAIFAAVADAM